MPLCGIVYFPDPAGQLNLKACLHTGDVTGYTSVARRSRVGVGLHLIRGLQVTLVGLVSLI